MELNQVKIAWMLLALLSFIAALTGILNPGIYHYLVDTKVMPGIISQDITTLIASTIMIILIFKIRAGDLIKQIIVIGLAGYLFYAYGIYVIERIYNELYFVYMAIFGISFYSMIYSVVGLGQDTQEKTVMVPGLIRYISMGFSLLMPVVFYPLWTMQILPLIKTGQKIEFLYSIYILDLCFIMPAFIIVAIKIIKNQVLGLLLAPALFILGFTLLFPVGAGELIKPLYNLPVDTAGLYLFLSLSFLFLVIAVLYLHRLHVVE